MSSFFGSSSSTTPGASTVASAGTVSIHHYLQTRLTCTPTDMQARKEKFMAQIRNELALNGAQELVNVCFYSLRNLAQLS